MAQKAEELSDYLLLAQCRQGSETAFNVLFRRYFTKLYKYTLSFTKDTSIAEELVMDVMLNLWLKKGEIMVQDELSPYIFRAMKNALINHWRKKALATTDLTSITHEHADSISADQGIMVKELTYNYELQLTALSPQRKKVFELSRKEDKSYKEIAKELNLSVKTVEHHISAALVFLRKNLKVISDTTLTTILFFFI